MKFRKVDKKEFTCHLLAKQTNRDKLGGFLKAVMASGNEISEVEWTPNYNSPKGACSALYKKCKEMKLNLRPTMRGDHVYLVRTDME